MKTSTDFLKRRFYYLIIILFAFSLAGCKKNEWYDVKSDKLLAVPTTLKDMQALMDNSTIMNNITPGMGEVASDGHYLNEATTLTLSGYNRNAYTWSHEQPNIGVTDWIQANGSNGSYKRIYYTNLVLEGLQKIKPLNDKEQNELNNIKGQALFHRAHAFHLLAGIFAPQYQVGNAMKELGIPLRITSDVNIESTRSTLKETYEQIIKDLMLAEDLLPMTALYKTRPNKVAVYALLARVYLSMQEYEMASVNANLCLENYNVLLDYNTLNRTTTANPISGYNEEVIFYSKALISTPISFSNLLIEDTWYNAYENNDLRKAIYFNQNATTKLVTFKGTYSGVGFVSPFSGMATDEVYLIRAECYARLGRVTEAIADLNALRRMRWLGVYTNITANSSDDALRKVLEERKKELIMRGLRWTDLRRLNLDSRFAITLIRTVGGKNYTLEPNSYKYTFPIPDDIIEITGMEQNEGWK